MEITYEKAAVQALAEDLASIQAMCGRVLDETTNAFAACRGRYTRLYTELEEQIRRARNALDAAESELRAAEAERSAAAREAERAEQESERSAAAARERQARSRAAEADSDRADASARLFRAQQNLETLISIWEEHSHIAETALRQAGEAQRDCVRLAANGRQDLGEFLVLMEKVRMTLSGEDTGGLA